MSQPFQFSMRRMFLAIAFFCVAVCLFVRADRYYQEVVLEEGVGEQLFEAMRAGAFFAIAGGVCVILRKSLLWLAIPFFIVFVYELLPRVY